MASPLDDESQELARRDAFSFWCGVDIAASRTLERELSMRTCEISPCSSSTSSSSGFSSISSDGSPKTRTIIIAINAHEKMRMEPFAYAFDHLVEPKNCKVVVVCCLSRLQDEMGLRHVIDVEGFGGIRKKALDAAVNNQIAILNHFLTGFRVQLDKRGVQLDISILAGPTSNDILVQAAKGLQPHWVVLDVSFSGHQRKIQEALECNLVLVRQDGKPLILKLTTKYFGPVDQYHIADTSTNSVSKIQNIVLSKKVPKTNFQTQGDLLITNKHNDSKSSFEEPHSHLGCGKGSEKFKRLPVIVDYKESLWSLEESEKGMSSSGEKSKKDMFIREVMNEGESGYFVSKTWLLSLGKLDGEEVLSVLWKTGYIEIYETHTTVIYERMEDDVQVPTICNDTTCTIEDNSVSMGDTEQVVASNRSSTNRKIEQAQTNSEKQLGKVNARQSMRFPLAKKIPTGPLLEQDPTAPGCAPEDGTNYQVHESRRFNSRYMSKLSKQPHYRRKVVVNGVSILDHMVKKAEERAGPIYPGAYWYDVQAGFWGVAGGQCLGIIPPFIEQFNYPMARDCAAGQTGIFVNGRELHHADKERLSRRGLPDTPGISYHIEIDGRVVEEKTGLELRGLGPLAPSLEKRARGTGMHVEYNKFVMLEPSKIEVKDTSTTGMHVPFSTCDEMLESKTEVKDTSTTGMHVPFNTSDEMLESKTEVKDTSTTGMHVPFNTSDGMLESSKTEVKDTSTTGMHVPFNPSDEMLESSKIEVKDTSTTGMHVPFNTSDEVLKSLKTEVKDTSMYNYSVSSQWLSTLNDHEIEDLDSALSKAGYSKTYKTTTTTYFERIRSLVQNSQTNQRGTGSTSRKIKDKENSSARSSGVQLIGDSLADDLRGSSMSDKGSKVVIAASKSGLTIVPSGPKTVAKCECLPQLLTVSCAPPFRSPMGHSTSSLYDEYPSSRQPVGDSYVTLPENCKGYIISTRVDKDISMTTFNFTETVGYNELNVSLNVSAETQLSCCLRSDRNGKKVRIDFLGIRGEVKFEETFDRRTNALVLKSVRTNVDACIKNSTLDSEDICLKIKEDCRSTWRRVLHSYRPLDDNGHGEEPEDLTWLELTGKRPKNSKVLSKTLDLQCHVKNRLKLDWVECSHGALILYFEGSSPVNFEGDILGDLDPNSFLELHVRYQVEVSYLEPCHPLPPADAIAARTKRVNKDVDFDCVLEFRTQNVSVVERKSGDRSTCSVM